MNLKCAVIARRIIDLRKAIQTNRAITMSLQDSAMPNRSNPNQTNLNARFVQHYTKIMQSPLFLFKQNFNFVVAKYVLLLFMALGFVGCSNSSYKSFDYESFKNYINNYAQQKQQEEKRRQQQQKEEQTTKELVEKFRKEQLAKCLGGNTESCNTITSIYHWNNALSDYFGDLDYFKIARGANFYFIDLNCKDYMKVIKKGCNLGSGLCCALLGDEYHPIADSNGQSYYGRDCSLRYQDEIYKYYRKACELGESEGCRKYRELEHFIYEIDTRERDKTQKSDITIRQNSVMLKGRIYV